MVRGLLFSLPLLMICIFFMIYSNQLEKNNQYAILTSYNAYVKMAPSQQSDDYFIIHEGIRFKIIDELDNWSRILLSDGKDGWVENQHFLTITK